ncbi:GNAT family N-acetyltransferase [Paenibacillus sp. R14(2021)]|uniref:GNAT family N-acetyltransferase n=1 Tax=Paenibacillus sp. R14(2021) TaxID=2859228 RepID=UPI001C614DA4|nr:GNAT family N-acetyltransferase [Paenibacillus sp. R14(2021)]
MNVHAEKMRTEDAESIVKWRYEQPYHFYDHESTPEAVQELLAGNYYTVFDNHDGLLGFYCVGSSAQVPSESYDYVDSYLDIGLGMRPDRTGMGKGNEFLSFVLRSIKEQYANKPLRLTVAAFNQRAIRLYRHFQFIETAQFTKGSTEFVVMYRASQGNDE